MNTPKASRVDAFRIDEKNLVENPLLDQLETLGWTVLRLEMTAPPVATRRRGFDEIIIRAELGDALRKLNPFLEDAQVEECIGKLSELAPKSLLENNREVWELLTGGTTVSVNHRTGETSPSVRYLDFDNPKNNSLLAVSQFKVRISGTEKHIIPDVVLLVNGLPLVVIECKSPRQPEPIAEAIDQLMRYSEQRGESGEGNRKLFWCNAFMVATCRTAAKFGTISTHIEKHFFRWLDPYPLSLDDLPSQGTSPNDQQRMVAGMCAPANLLSILRDFTVFSEDDKGRSIKIVARYQQFRAVKLGVKRLIEGGSRGERSGIIWHTQGSGKSLTMLFMVREMRRETRLGGWKIVFLTDRTQLQDQLGETSGAIGQTVKVADSTAKLKQFLAHPAPDVVMAMIQKFQERDLSELFPRLNDSSEILILIDEAHRTQYSLLAANMERAMPNATRIAYTGTPIAKTENSFGDYIDKYTMRQSVDEGTTLQITYEGRTHNAQVADKAAMDAAFADIFSDYNLTERLQILGYGSREAYLESQPVIEAKARDMVEHYATHVFPNGFKGQVVATSREAAYRYKVALDEALRAKIEELERSNPFNIDVDKLRRVETACIISGGDQNERPHLKPFTDSTYHRSAIKRFKLAFDAVDEDGEERAVGNVGLIVVNNMLLTGFDAPIEQVLYLDRVMVDHNLLQAIARVNRVGEAHKEEGFIIDYVGVGHHLKAALETFAEKEQQEILDVLQNADAELGELGQAHADLWALLHKHGVSDFSDPDAFYDLFYDEELRYEYVLAFRRLTRAFNVVLPRKEALDYWSDYQNFAKVNELASRHLRDARLSMKGVPEKLRRITDQYLESQGIDLKIAPISILSDDFGKEVGARRRAKTKAAEIEHAVRNYLEVNFDEDPELFASFAEELEGILARFADNWNRIYEELEKLRGRIKSREREETYGLDRKREMPAFRIFKRELFEDEEVSGDDLSRLVELSKNATETLTREARLSGFWSSTPAQNKLKADLQSLLLSREFHTLPGIVAKRQALISRLMEWGRENYRALIGP